MLHYKIPSPEVKQNEFSYAKFLAKCREDFTYFANIILGYHDLNHEHVKVCKFLQDDPNKFKMLLLPRLTFKSCLITQGYTIWQMIRNPDIRILIYSDSTLKSQGFLRGIKNHIEGRAGRSLFREFFGEWESEQTWNETQIIIDAREVGSVEPTVDTGGIETSKVGMHYDLIIFDDIVSDMNITSKQQMDKVYDCYKKSLSLLTRNGKVVIVGTRWHFGDMYGKLIDDNKDNQFSLMIRDAEEKREDGGLIFDNIGPESLTQDHLNKLKERQGTYLYSCLYRNNPVDDDTALFKTSQFTFYNVLKKSEGKDGLYPELFITATVDPAGSGNDKTAITIVGTDNEMNMHILECYNRHAKPLDIVDFIMNMNHKYKIRMLGIETIFYRGLLSKELQIRIKQEQLGKESFNNFGITEFGSSSRRGDPKFIRIQALQPYHERGQLRFPGKTFAGLSGTFADLAYQMIQVTPSHMPEPNDLIDSLADHVKLVMKGTGFTKTEDIPENSPAWLEKQWVTSHNRSQKMLPRRMRKTFKLSLS